MATKTTLLPRQIHFKDLYLRFYSNLKAEFNPGGMAWRKDSTRQRVRSLARRQARLEMKKQRQQRG